MENKLKVNWPNGLKLRTEPEPTNRTFTGITAPNQTVVDAIGEPHQYDARFAFQKVRTPDGTEGWLTLNDGHTTYLLAAEPEVTQPQPQPEPPPPAPSDTQYTSGTAFQHDKDNPVRPAHLHADKNFQLRGYTANNDPNLKRELVDYGSDDPTQPPQFATLFSPPRVPAFKKFFRVHNWNWGTPPDPGTRGDPSTQWPVTALGLTTTPGEPLHVPKSGYDIGGCAVIVIFADERTIALKYTREDSAATGYTVHVDNIITDRKLLALYSELDDPMGPRYKYPNESYNLPTLTAGQPFGRARGKRIVVAIVDTGTFMDIRSANEWWQIRPGYTGSCPRP